MLQTRNAKRPAQAAVRFAVDAVEEGLLDKRAGDRHDRRRTARRAAPSRLQARRRLRRARRGRGRLARRREGRHRLHRRRRRPRRGGRPRRDPRPPVHRGRRRGRLPRREGHPHRRGRQGEPRRAGGARDGEAVRVRRLGARHRPPREDAQRERHAARRGRPDRDRRQRRASSPPTTCRSRRPRCRTTSRPSSSWADELRTLGVRTNADTPEDARRAREFGAEGIGLCRTEHMFMAEDRQPKMRAMIMAETEEERRAALGELLPLQQGDFEGLFGEMEGLPVTIRLLDPPLHEFMPQARGGRAGAGARAHRADRQPRGARAHARAHPLAVGDEPDARHARRAARRAPPRDLRDADPRDLPRRAARSRRRRRSSRS